MMLMHIYRRKVYVSLSRILCEKSIDDREILTVSMRGWDALFIICRGEMVVDYYPVGILSVTKLLKRLYGRRH